MVKVRQDAWSHEDDLLLAETVLRHIREGSTQLNAFEEVGDALNRTSAACGFRWNAEVRMKYDNAIDLAKRQRKEKKRAEAGILSSPVKKEIDIANTLESKELDDFSESQPSQTDIVNEEETTIDEPSASFNQQNNPLSLDMVIDYLGQLKTDYYTSKQSRNTLEETQTENNLLRERVTELDQTLTKTKEQLNNIQEENQVFMQIMDRARKMTVLEDQGTLKAPAFRMDKNGNLQQLAEGSN